MKQAHPKLRLRPQLNPRLKRPVVELGVLGKLEYVNRDGGWWQGRTSVGRESVRLDLQKNSRVTLQELEYADDLLRWIQLSESRIRSHAAQQLLAGSYRSNVKEQRSVTDRPKLTDAAMVDLIRPYLLVIWDQHADLTYHCDELPSGKLLGSNAIQVTIDSTKSPKSVFLMALGLGPRANDLLGRPLPPDLTDFENSIPDQFVAETAAWGSIDLDRELTELLMQTINEVRDLSRTGSPERRSYLRSVELVLEALIEKNAAKAKD